MPTYTYQLINPDGSDGAITELVQRMSEPAHTHHPETGQPMRRIIVSAPAIGGVWSERSGSNALADHNLARKGFTKYVNNGDGTYDKTAGEGPDTISR